VSVKSPPVSNTDREHESPIVTNTYRVVWIALPKRARDWDRDFVVSRPTRPQSPVNVLLDLLWSVLELRAVEKCRHQFQNVAGNLRPSSLHPVVGLPMNIGELA
jgi:hypothetical protein